jgi:hypothetical protein
MMREREKDKLVLGIPWAMGSFFGGMGRELLQRT